MKNTKGFTLIEILMVIFVLALLGTAAISSYINSTGIFNFLNQYQQVVAVMRTARSYALTNKQVANPAQAGDYILPDRYGVYIDAAGKQVTLFADTGDVPSFYDGKNDDTDTQYDVVIGSKDVFLGKDYVLSAADSTGTNTLALPVAFFYTVGTGDLVIFEKAGVSATSSEVKKSDHKCVSLLFNEAAAKRSKYIVFFQVSGLAEEYDKLEVCKG